jgi:hypothetical protein
MAPRRPASFAFGFWIPPAVPAERLEGLTAPPLTLPEIGFPERQNPPGVNGLPCAADTHNPFADTAKKRVGRSVTPGTNLFPQW